MSAVLKPDLSPGLRTNNEVRKTTRLYLLVGLVLFCGTGVTVAIATVPWLDIGGHGFDRWDALLGISIASFKAFLVAAVFMHLNHERGLIYGVAILAGIHATGFFVGTYWHFADMISDPHFYQTPIGASTESVGPPEGGGAADTVHDTAIAKDNKIDGYRREDTQIRSKDEN